MIPQYPLFSEITLDMRPVLHVLFQSLTDGISEFTFANLYLFRKTNQLGEYHKDTLSIVEKWREGRDSG